jgi:hypothetical protein
MARVNFDVAQSLSLLVIVELNIAYSTITYGFPGRLDFTKHYSS